MTRDEIISLQEERGHAEIALFKAKGAFERAIHSLRDSTVPVGMKVVDLVVEYEEHDYDREETFSVAVPVETGKTLFGCYSGYKYHDSPGVFNSNTPVGMLVFDEDETSETWLQWRPWKEVFEDFEISDLHC